MKIKYLINIFLIIITIINKINCFQAKCPEGPNYNFQDSHCKEYSLVILKPTILLYNFYDYTNITCLPNPIKQYIDYLENVYKIILDNNSSYTCTLKSPICSEDQFIEVGPTKTGPQLLITQPKCVNSLATIDFITGDDVDKASYGYQINGETVTLPFEMLLNTTDFNNFTSNNDGILQCKSKFYINQGSIQSYPNISIIHATCNKGGKISITNSQSYSSIVLLKSNGELIAPKSNGIFENLVSDNYAIVLESSQCGKQKFEVALENQAPNYKLNLINDECPLKPMYKLELDSQYSYNISLNGNKASNPFIINSGEANLTLNIESCGIFKVPIYKLYSIPPIHYTISDTSDFCSGIYSVNLLYNSTLVPNLKGLVKSNNSSTPLVIKDYSKFDIVYNNQNYIYQLESECFSDPIQITAPSRKPHYEISKASTKYCNELVDIKIINYLDFSTLKLHANGVYYQHLNGLFKNVPNQLYDVQFIYRNCSKELNSIQIGSKGQANIYFTSKVIKYPTCSEIQRNGLVVFTIYDNFTNNKIMDTEPQPFYYNNYLSTPFSINLNSLNCYANLTFKYTYQKPEYKINVLKKPTCKYSNDGLVEIVSNNSAILRVDVNGGYQPTLKAVVNGGLNKIMIGVFEPCIGDEITYNVEPEYSDFEVLYDTTPVYSCDNGNGSISIKDYEKYSKLLIDGQALINGTTGNTKDSGYHSVDFSIQLGNNSNEICSGSKIVFIPTTIETDIQYRLVTKPLCYNAEGSVFIESVKDKSGKSYNIDQINGKEGNSYIYPLHVNNFTINNNIITIKSGSCSWNKQLDIQEIRFNISAELSAYNVQDCIGYTRYKIKTTAPYSTNGYFQEDGLYFDYYTVNSKDGDQFIDLIDGSDICFAKVFLKAINPTIPNIKYNIQSNGGDSSCLSSFTTINIQVENYMNYKSLNYDGIPINSNGYFLNVRSGGTITGELLNFDCKLSEKVKLNDTLIKIDKSIINETCYESLNGEIQINQDNQNYHYLIQNDQQEIKSYYSLKSNSSTSSFSLLGSQNIRIIKMNKQHPTCIEYELYKMDTIEPEVIYDDQVCSNDQSLGFSINKKNLNGDYSIYDSSYQKLSSSNYTSLNKLEKGKHNYSIEFTINTEYCKRKLLSPPISINSKKCNNNLGLKIGLPIGLFFFVLFVAAGIIIYKRRLQLAKVKDVAPITHDYNSVKIFTGNKLQDIDKF